MEPLLGCTLHDAFPRRIKALYAAHEEAIAKQMHMDMIRTVVRQLLVALAHMHSNSLIHADIKTTNVICVNDTSLKVKLIDFGNSVSDGDVSEYYSTFEIQTVWFRAPEVAYQRPFGRAIDIWSIGCIMCELWLGRSLFTDMDNPGLIHSILKLHWDPQLRMQWLKHSLHVQDDDFVSLADALLEYDPEERLTAAEALEHPFFQGMYAL
ncbi:kinase-like domain-containing protein [Coemansia spiralis]|nr:kinase-like domain-containing protein [Coemansia spiralis]